MRLTQSTVERGLVVLEPDDFGVLQAVQKVATIALAQCERCGSRRRALPCDVLPYKTYGVDVIEQQVSAYSRGDLSLRQVVWRQYGERTPAHTTLHGWTEGAGAHFLDRPGGRASGAPMSRLIAEAQPRKPEIVEVLRSDPTPDPRRYRSEARRERLVAVMLTMALVVSIAGRPHPYAMAECRRLLLVWSNVSVLGFPSRILRTPIEHRDRSKPARSRSSSPRSRYRCPTRTRSPPDDSSRSPS